ncbi:MAG: hypothetical protein WAV38_10185 [Xanthobacteraceae bacterium]
MRPIAEQDIAKDGEEDEQNPGGERDAIAPSRLGIPFRVQYIVHTGKH